MHNRVLLFLTTSLTLLGILFFAAPQVALADAPDSINYQGVLTDAGGNPVTDGNYSVTLSIYSSAIGGVALWSETKNVTTTNGLFNTLLGSVTPLSSSVFSGPNRFLGTTVSPDPEMTPRTAIVTVPYSHRVSTVDGATGGTIDGNVDIEGDLTAYDGADPALEVDVSGSQIRTFGSDGLEQTRIWGVGFGELLLNDNTDNNQTVRLSATTNSGGELHLDDELGVASIVLDGGASGDASAVLPVGAINNDEIIDEPGIANRIQGAAVVTSGGPDSILVRTITAPVDGYVVAFATADLEMFHSTGSFTSADLGIVPPGGTLGSSPFVSCFITGNAPTGNVTMPAAVTAAFDVNAGANQFALVVDRSSSSGNPVRVDHSQLTLLFVPTAYGLVTSNVANGTEGPLESPESELDQAKQFNSQRMANELQELRAKLDALQTQMNQNEN